MRLIQNEKECQIVFCLRDPVLKTQCCDLYDYNLIRHIQLTYRGSKVRDDDDLVDTVRVRLPPTTPSATIVAIIRFMRLVLYHSE